MHKRSAPLALGLLALAPILACGFSGDIAASRDSSLSEEQRRVAVGVINDTCADSWCEGPVSLWFHDVRCTGGTCRLDATVRMSASDWQAEEGSLPSRRTTTAQPVRWRVGHADSVLDEVTHPEVPSVLMDVVLEVDGPMWDPEDEGPSEAFLERVGSAIEGWRPPR